MPKTKRDYLKRKVAQIYYNIDGVLDAVKFLDDTFDPVHPDLSSTLKAVAVLLITAQEGIAAFAETAWEMPVSSMKSYRED